jgi:uncharacterized membrane protein YfcA
MLSSLPTATKWLFVALAGFTAFYLVHFIRAVLARPAGAERRPKPQAAGVGFVTAFFDTLGIGSFATTTTLFRWFKLIDDAVLPGTLNVGITLPTIVQAFIYTRLIPVDATTLILMIGASVLGAWLGVPIVSRLPKRSIQLSMGVALLVAATIFLGGLLKFLPAGGEALALTGPKLVFGLLGNFVLGALMTCGIGLYGPCMVLVALLGLTPAAAFPIMMGSCAFLMPIASARFMKTGRYDMKLAMGLAIGSIPAVLVAAFLVVSLPLDYVKWLVVIVVTYTAITLLRAAKRSE